MNSRLYLEPVSFVSGAAARALVSSGDALPLGNAGRAFTAIRIHRRTTRGVNCIATVPIGRIDRLDAEYRPAAKTALAALQRQRPSFAGLAPGRPAIMGVLNVTPDSFSDGGDFFDHARAVDRGLEMIDAGADVVDVGGESTRPGAAPVSEDEEIRRVIPVVAALAERGVLVSIDTRHAGVMRRAFDHGARIVNDVSALTGDRDSLAVVAGSGASVILMHMRGEPVTMQNSPRYTDVLADVYDYLEARVAACREGGIEESRIAVDPGIGFGKTAWHNLRLIDGLATFRALGCSVVLGVSRKGFIGRIGKAPAAKDRLPGSLALALAGRERGADILRVHDVAESRQAAELWEAVTLVTDGDDPSG